MSIPILPDAVIVFAVKAPPLVNVCPEGTVIPEFGVINPETKVLP